MMFDSFSKTGELSMTRMLVVDGWMDGRSSVREIYKFTILIDLADFSMT